MSRITEKGSIRLRLVASIAAVAVITASILAFNAPKAVKQSLSVGSVSFLQSTAQYIDTPALEISYSGHAASDEPVYLSFCPTGSTSTDLSGWDSTYFDSGQSYKTITIPAAAPASGTITVYPVTSNLTMSAVTTRAKVSLSTSLTSPVVSTGDSETTFAALTILTQD